MNKDAAIYQKKISELEEKLATPDKITSVLSTIADANRDVPISATLCVPIGNGDVLIGNMRKAGTSMKARVLIRAKSALAIRRPFLSE